MSHLKSNNKQSIYNKWDAIDYEYLYSESIEKVYYRVKCMVSDERTVSSLIAIIYRTAFKEIHALKDKTIGGFCKGIEAQSMIVIRDYLKVHQPVLYPDSTCLNTVKIKESPEKTANQHARSDIHEISKIIQYIFTILPSDQRLALFLLYYDHATTQEISVFLNQREKITKIRISEAEQHVAAFLEERDVMNSIVNISVSRVAFTTLLTLSEKTYDIPDYLGNGVVTYQANVFPQINQFFIFSGLGMCALFLILFVVSIPSFVETKNNYIQTSFFGELTSEAGRVIKKDASPYKVHADEVNDYSQEIVKTPKERVKNTDMISMDTPSQNNDIAVETDTELEEQVRQKTQFVDVFYYLNLDYSGYNGLGSIQLSWSDIPEKLRSFFDTVTFTISKDSNLKNGDIISIHVSAKNTDLVVLDQSSRDFEVDTLASVTPEIPIFGGPSDKERTPYSKVYNTVLYDMNEEFVSEIISSLSHDYYGNNMGAVDYTSIRIDSFSYEVYTDGLQLSSYATLYVSDGFGNQIEVGVIFTFDDAYKYKTVQYAINIDPYRNLSGFELPFTDSKNIANPD